MATITDDLAKAVTEGFRQAQIDIANQDKLLVGPGDVTLTRPDGSTLTGPSWPKLVTAANAAGVSAAAAATSATNAKTSETNANSSKTAAASSETNALASKNAAKTSETNAKTSETNAKTSENNAKTSETNAATSLAAAQALTSVPYEDAPYPDVWAPLSDDLRLLAGSAPYDTLTISGKVLELPSKSMTFTRSTTATYIDKSGVLQTAAINEPRFEREGLLMEGAATNNFLNTSTPASWNSDSTITKSSIIDGATQALTFQGTTTSLSTNLVLINSPGIAGVANDTFTISARFKGAAYRVRYRFLLDGALIGDAYFDCATGALAGSVTGPVTYTSMLGGDGYTYASVTLTIPSAGSVSGNIWFNNSTNMPVGSVIFVQTPQFEKSAVATSYIPTGSSAATRSAEFLNLQALCNVGYRLVGDLIKRTMAFELTVNKFAMTGSYLDLVEALGATYDKMLRLGVGGTSTTLQAYRSGQSAGLTATYPFYNQTFAHTLENNNITIYFNNNKFSRDSAPTTPTSGPTFLRFSSNSAVVYHIRNFRIWHRLLTPNQINGLR